MKKYIQISNQKELNKFYQKIPIYKSMLFYFTNFQIEIDQYNILPIINALNIKSRKKRIQYIYNEACKQIDQYYENRNVCDFRDNQCIVQRKNKRHYNGCCRKCQYQSNNGCKTSNLTCKLFYCETVKSKNKILGIKDIPILKCLSIRQRILLKSTYFSSAEDVIMDLYIGSLFISVIRIYYRLIKYFIISKIKKEENH